MLACQVEAIINKALPENCEEAEPGACLGSLSQDGAGANGSQQTYLIAALHKTEQKLNEQHEQQQQQQDPIKHESTAVSRWVMVEAPQDSRLLQQQLLCYNILAICWILE